MKLGFIKLHRSLLDWEWYNDPNTCRLFIHLLLNANFKASKWRGISLERGEVIVGRKELAKSIGLTEQQTRTSLNKLKSTNEITIKTSNKFSIVKLVNYSIYQDIEEDKKLKSNQQPNQQVTNNQPTNNQQITTDKECNKERKKETPLTPQGEDFKIFKGGVGELIAMIDEKILSEIKEKAKGLDFYHLCGCYIQFLKANGLPKDINKAFPAWCGSYIKNAK